MTRRICVVTGSRAEYGLLRRLMQGIADAPELTLQVVATGMHLSSQFGSTYREIEADGFTIDRKLETLLDSDSSTSVAKAMGLGIMGLGDALDQLRPHVIVLLGDRFEIFSAAAAALVLRIPIAHIHGGESTEGAFDEAIRHSITKMSHLHFVAAEAYRRRVIQLGEPPERVFLVGGLGVDAISHVKVMGRPALEADLNFKFAARNLLVTFHPVTLDSGSSQQMRELLAALDALKDTGLIFTMPNADPEGKALHRLVVNFAATHPNARVYESLGQLRYLSCIRQVDAVVGNSSSGLTEVPSFAKATINIGDRQKGRLRAASVIDCAPERHAIGAALARLYSPEFQSTLASVRNPYGDGGASARIVRVLRDHPLDALLQKSFHDSDGVSLQVTSDQGRMR